MFFWSEAARIEKKILPHLAADIAFAKRVSGALPVQFYQDPYILGWLTGSAIELIDMTHAARLFRHDQREIAISAVRRALGKTAPSARQLRSLLKRPNETPGFMQGLHGANVAYACLRRDHTYDDEPWARSAIDSARALAKVGGQADPERHGRLHAFGLLLVAYYNDYVMIEYGSEEFARTAPAVRSA